MSQQESIIPQKLPVFLHKVRLLDLGPLAYQLMESRSGPRWTNAQTIRAIARYLAFLYLVHAYPHLPLIPTWEIDQVWHQHILDTHKYAEDCHVLFGQFIHHFPYVGTRGEVDRANWSRTFALTLVLFYQHFGIDLAADQQGAPADCEPLQVELREGMGCRSIVQQRPRVDIPLTDALQLLTTNPAV